jgi:hypothetical protein
VALGDHFRFVKRLLKHLYVDNVRQNNTFEGITEMKKIRKKYFGQKADIEKNNNNSVQIS